jgi:O-antigen ligase
MQGSARPGGLVAAGAGALFVLNMAFVTPGRSGYLALGVMLVVLTAGSLRGWRNLLLVGTLGALFAAALALSPLARDRIGTAVTEWRTVATAGVKTSMGIRANLYENTLELVRERPWFGVGTGGFERAYGAHVKDKYSDWRALGSGDPHNQYLFFLAEQGVVGLLAFLAFIGLALADRGDGGRLRVVAVGMLLAWCATSLLSSHFQTFAEGHLLAFFLAAMLARPVPGLDAPGTTRSPAPS